MDPTHAHSGHFMALWSTQRGALLVRLGHPRYLCGATRYDHQASDHQRDGKGCYTHHVFEPGFVECCRAVPKQTLLLVAGERGWAITRVCVCVCATGCGGDGGVVCACVCVSCMTIIQPRMRRNACTSHRQQQGRAHATYNARTCSAGGAVHRPTYLREFQSSTRPASTLSDDTPAWTPRHAAPYPWHSAAHARRRGRER
jgi:hypothetical protein